MRYVHTHTGLMDLEDYGNLVKLLEGIIMRLDWDAIQQIKNGE